MAELVIVDSDDDESLDVTSILNASKPNNKYLQWTTYFILLLISLPIIILTPQYPFQLLNHNNNAWIDKFYSIFTPNGDYFTSTESISTEQSNFYSQIEWQISLHTIASPLWLFFGFIYFNSYIRDRYKIIHKISNYAYFIALFASLTGSGAMILSMTTKAKQSDDDTVKTLVYTKNGASHIYLLWLQISGMITGRFILCFISTIITFPNNWCNVHEICLRENNVHCIFDLFL